MPMNHILRYHVLIPAGVIAILLVAGAPVGTAFIVGMMSGCISMMLMMGAGSQGPQDHEGQRHDRPWGRDRESR